ncbi:MAG: thioredoxin, partial [Chloroflexi bacterium]|nr:thioredoxin [Chloroflexota bacterium]
MPVLSSTSYEVDDALAAIELYMEQGWTDGLPVVPPTEDRVLAMLRAAGCRPDDVVGEVPIRQRTITAEKVAINAVMAGCKPEDFPVVLAAVEALCTP